MLSANILQRDWVAFGKLLIYVKKGVIEGLILGEHQEEARPLKATFCLRSVKKFTINLRRLSDISYDLSLQTSPLCQTLSSALEMSKKTALTSIGGLLSNEILFFMYYTKSCEVQQSPEIKPGWLAV